MTTRQQLVSTGLSCTLVLLSNAFGVDSPWDGNDSEDWNNPNSWGLNRVTVEAGAADHAAVKLKGSATLSLTDLGDKFALLAYDSLSGTFANSATDDQVWPVNGGDWLLNYNDSTVGLNGGGDLQTPAAGYGDTTITAVPEPPVAAASLGSIGLLALVRRRRG